MDFDITNISDIGLSKLLDRETVRELFTAIGDIIKTEISLFDINKKKYSEIKIARQYICKDLEEGSQEASACERVKKAIVENLPSIGMKRIDCESGFSYLLSPLDYETEIVGYISLGPYISYENKSKVEDFCKRLFRDNSCSSDILQHYKVMSNQEASQLMKNIKQMLSAFLYSSYKMYLTSKMHLETQKESYAEIEILNNRLNEMLAEVESVSRYKTAFIKTITHELRTPLTSIIGYSDILKKEFSLNPEALQYVDTISQKGLMLLKIINDILILSSIESGSIEVHKEIGDISEDISKIINEFYPETEKKALRVSFTNQLQDTHYMCDHEKLKVVFSKILDNAIKFTDEGGSIAVFLYEKVINPESQSDRFGVTPKRYIVITVEDTGVGIEEDKIHMVFEPFYQAVSNMDTREKSGMGLGLKIARGYTEAMGGELKIESQIGIGTKVSILLPG
jgi:signal transduction histidine kinase